MQQVCFHANDGPGVGILVPYATMFPEPMNTPPDRTGTPTQIQRESDLVPMLERAVGDRLPRGWLAEVRWNPRLPGWQPDAMLTLIGPDGTRASSLVEAKLELEPREIDPALSQLERASIDLPPDAGERGAPTIVSRFVSSRSKSLIEEAGANYVDATGNLRLALARPALFISTEGATMNPWRATRDLQSLKGRTAAKVIRALCELPPPFGVRELAERSVAAPSSVSRTLDFLSREALVVRDGKQRVTAVLVAELIRRWSDDFRFNKQNDIVRLLESRGLQRALDRLRDSGSSYAITGSFAANVVAPYAEPQLLVAYADDLPRLEAELGTRRAETSSNLWLAAPPDDLPFVRTQSRDGLRYAATAQVACDLFGMPGRSPEEAEAILRLLDAGGGVGVARTG